MLEIRDVQFFPDGRSLVDTIGGKRFKVVSRARRDGYNTAKVEFIEDTPITAEQYQGLSDIWHFSVKFWYFSDSNNPCSAA